MSPDPVPAWQGNWNERLYQRIRRFGSETVLEFLAQFPRSTYMELSDKLGEDVAPVQLQHLQFTEALESGQVREAAMDGLVRVLRDGLLKGWNSREPRNSAANCAYGAWAGMLETRTRIKNPDVLLAIWRSIEGAHPPEGWLPDSPKDLILQEAFNKHWPPGEEV
jgi:hypothetical protein